jgi:hypothetical protein
MLPRLSRRSRPTRNPTQRAARGSALLRVAVALALGSCGPGAAASREDQRSLGALLEADMAVAEVLRRADALTVGGQGRQAAAVLDGEARPQASANVDRAHLLAPRTPWGAARGQEVTRLLDDRRSSIDAYAAALRADDVDKVIETLEASKEIERRGLALSQAVRAEPASRGGCGG